jgi:FkbM family methyltransferase
LRIGRTVRAALRGAAVIGAAPWRDGIQFARAMALAWRQPLETGELQMSLRDLVERGSDTIRDKFSRERAAPYFRDKAKLMLGIAQLRDTIRQQKSADIRRFLAYCVLNMQQSHSQIFQDLFVAYVLRERSGGFFCEFGATDGLSLSNSMHLERDLGWSGICAEPARGWHEALARNRPNARIETRCVWSRSGETLEFTESATREYSTIGSFSQSDGHARKRSQAESYPVQTVALNDLLERHGAPADFDYLSMDTEGSELQILEALDFSRFKPKVITVEHNFMSNRLRLHTLLKAQHYERVLPECSQFDDWYLAPGIALPG